MSLPAYTIFVIIAVAFVGIASTTDSPLPGGWRRWSSFSRCSECNSGQKTRVRSCMWAQYGRTCRGSSSEVLGPEQYFRINSGTCETNGIATITTKVQCQAALKDLQMTSAFGLSSGASNSLPYGCIFTPTGSKSVWNSLNSNNTACGSPPSNFSYCICINSVSGCVGIDSGKDAYCAGFGASACKSSTDCRLPAPTFAIHEIVLIVLGVIIGVLVSCFCCRKMRNALQTKSSVRDRESSLANRPTHPAQTTSSVSNVYVDVSSPSPQENIQIHPVPPAPPIDTRSPPDLPPPTYEESILQTNKF